MNLHSNDPRKSPGARMTWLGDYPVRLHVDGFAARRGVRMHATALGFTKVEAEELALATSELCSNIVKYGIRGTLHVDRLEHLVHGAAIVLDAEDIGPPFRDFEKAVRDGCDDRGTIPPETIYKRQGIGTGLGAVRRLTHVLFVDPLSAGKRVLAVRFLKRPHGAIA